MIRFKLLSLALFALAAAAHAEVLSATSDLAIRTEVTRSTEALTVDRIAELDPGQPNPQLRRWVISRKVGISGWKSRKLSSGLTGVHGGLLEAVSTIYLRAPGAWYDEPSQFPCHEKAFDPVFATQDGADELANQSANLWDAMLREGRKKLTLLLAKVAAVNEKSAATKADRVFQEWLVRLDRDWRARVSTSLARTEWEKERARAVKAGYCKTAARALKPRPMTRPEVWMAQDTPTPIPSPSVLPATRAPSRRWQGNFAVRMDLAVGDNSILGQMLIDPGTNRSVLSGDWMRAQGLTPEWLLIPEAQPEHVKISAGPGYAGLGEVLRVEHAVLSDFQISLTRFLRFHTDLYDQPEFASECCSGVFGMDFLRRYVVEFRPGKLSAIQLWKTAAFHPLEGYEWVEVREDAQGELKPVCTERVKKIVGAEKMCRDPKYSLKQASQEIIFDLPHGRIWFSPAELLAPRFENHSGLGADFDFVNGDRTLLVRSIDNSSPAADLEKLGLRKGSVIDEVDGTPAIELDLWEVNRRLAGVYGPRVTLKWKDKSGVGHSESLKVGEPTTPAPGLSLRDDAR